MSGITSSGFVRKTRDEIKTDLIDFARTQFGQDVDFSPYSYEGQLLEIAVENTDQIWQELENQYYQVYPQSATGAQLDRIGAYSGVTRRPAIQASVSLTFTGVNGTVINSGFAVQTANGIGFSTTETGTITGGTLTVNGLADTAGTIGIVSENSIIEIVNPQAGVDTVTNPLPSFGGLEIESDLEYRARILGLGISGKASAARIQKEIALLTGVSTAKVFENPNDFEYLSLPGHSIEVIVSGGIKEEIGAKIYELKPAGVQSVSNYAVSTGQIKVKAKTKGKVFYQLTLVVQGSTFSHSTIGSGIFGDFLNFIIYCPTTADYLDLKAYIDSDISTYLSAEISGSGNDSITAINSIFTPDSDTSYTFLDEFGVSQTIEFSRPVLVYVKVIVNLEINDQWVESNQGLVIENVVKTIGGLYNGTQYTGLGIGVPVKEWNLISAQVGVSGIDSINYLMSLSPATPISNATIEIQSNEQAQILQADVSVVYV